MDQKGSGKCPHCGSMMNENKPPFIHKTDEGMDVIPNGVFQKKLAMRTNSAENIKKSGDV